MIHRPLQRLLVLAAFMTGCASAGERLEQGMEAEAAGSYYEAAVRYIEALEKDAALGEARDRLIEAGDSAVSLGLVSSAERVRTGDPDGAAQEFLTLDGLIGRAREVGVRIPTPTGYAQERRNAFDDAIRALMAQSGDAAERGQWTEARQALNRVRRDLAPSAEQRGASETAEAYLLLTWAESEENDGRHRRSFELAGEALTFVRPAPADLVDGAEALRDRALANGTRSLAVFPVTVTAPAREQMDGHLDQELADLLELEYWRAPPLFVLVSDPVLVRQVIRRLSPPGASFRPGRVLDEVGADFGVMVELTGVSAAEQSVRRQSRQARTKDGRITSYVEESGTVNYTLAVQVTVVDEGERNVAQTTERSTKGGSFERGVYPGDYRELDLSRGEARLFDPVVISQGLAQIQESALIELAEEVAGEVFDRVLSRIP